MTNGVAVRVGPGRCVVCSRTVWWQGKYWREGRHRHRCPDDRPECGSWMPFAKERCGRKPGHSGSCRSRWVMDSEAERRRKWRAA